jgi:hypothetical protein
MALSDATCKVWISARPLPMKNVTGGWRQIFQLGKTQFATLLSFVAREFFELTPGWSDGD